MADIARCDLLFVPGGLASTDVINNLAFMAEFKRLAAGARYLTSVCTGSLVLGAAGLLKGKHAACHWAWRDMLSLFDAVPDPRRVVRDCNVITGGGVTAGIDFALVVAASCRGKRSRSPCNSISNMPPHRHSTRVGQRPPRPRRWRCRGRATQNFCRGGWKVRGRRPRDSP
jgi:transcriptional regulator GlxA family with amidase domain